MVQLLNIFGRPDVAIEEENQSRRADDFEESELIGASEIRVMAQMSLLTNDIVTAQIALFGTRDE